MQNEIATENQIPNFDAMTAEDLFNFALKFRKPSRKAAAELIGDTRDGYTKIARELARYAEAKCVAMKARAKGAIGNALSHEELCDRIYDSLPEDLRW